MGCIAILHYTASPAIGGVESLIDAQLDVLTTQSMPARLIIAEGTGPEGVELSLIPELHPRYAEGAVSPQASQELQQSLVELLTGALDGCDACWVHNAFTVYLHPPLTAALIELARTLPLDWVAWCADVSLASAFWQGSPLPLPDTLHHVAISETRKRDLARYHRIPLQRIRVIPPPLHQWFGAELLALMERFRLWEADPLILVPAKLLPHKNLPLAVRVAAHLGSGAALLITGAFSPHESARSRRVAQDLEALAEAEDVRLSIAGSILGRPLGRAAVRDLMQLADLILLPSCEEGFGLPVREAIASRAPVLCADISAFRESGGAAARYFPLDAPPEDIAAQIREILNDPVVRAHQAVVRSPLHFARDLTALFRHA